MAGYTSIASGDKISDSRDVLNGTATRRVSLEFARHHDAGSGTSRATNGNVFTEAFSVTDTLHANWVVCDRVAADTNATLRLHFLMETAGSAGQEVKVDVGYFTIDPTQNDGTELSSQTPTVVTGADTDVSAFGANSHWVIAATIPLASITNGEIVCFEIVRTSATTLDYTDDCGLMAVEVLYTIQR